MTRGCRHVSWQPSALDVGNPLLSRFQSECACEATRPHEGPILSQVCCDEASSEPVAPASPALIAIRSLRVRRDPLRQPLGLAVAEPLGLKLESKASGKRRSRSFKTKSAARIFEKANVEDQQAANRLDPACNPHITVGEYAPRYTEAKRARGAAERTLLSLRTPLAQIAEYFHGKRLVDVRRRDVLDFLQGLLNRGLAPGTVRLTAMTLSGIFTTAIDDELVASNPVAGMSKKLNLSRNAKEEVKSLSAAEANAFIAAAREHAGRFFGALAIGLYAGLRPGEIRRLTRDDLDLVNQRIQVHGTKTEEAPARSTCPTSCETS